MSLDEAAAKVQEIGRDVFIRQRNCVPLFGKPTPSNPYERLKDASGQAMCSASALHGPGCGGGINVCSIERPNPAGTEVQILAMGSTWDEVFAAYRQAYAQGRR
jgi:hypothetical protein